jgi:hypothetical protein
VPALAWLCEEHLPRQPEWPRDLSPHGALGLEWTTAGWRAFAATAPSSHLTVLQGSLTLGNDRILVHCAVDGSEDWYVPAALAVPPPWQALWRGLDAGVAAEPHRLDVGIAIGHLAGGLADGDPRGQLLRHGAMACGELTWLYWNTATERRVRGCSDGGLTLPALLALLAAERTSTVAPLPTTAFARRDGTRDEATRRLVRADAAVAMPTLRALLHAEDSTRLAAIDALVRREATAELPRIVAAATPTTPWATLAATDAVRALWPAATEATRQATRQAIARCASPALRGIDLAALGTAANAALLPSTPASGNAGTTDTAPARLRALLWLGVVGLGLWVALVRARRRAAELPA